MSETANCPICGCVPNLDILGYEDIPSISHCGATFESIVKWNRYAAAMELAMLEYKFEFCKSEDEHKYQELIALARKQIVWAFK